VLLAIVVGMLVSALDTHAQTGTWVAHEEDWRDYVVLSEDVLMVVRIDDRGECMGAPMSIRMEGDTLRRRRGADWHLKVRRGQPDSLVVTTPNFRRAFERTLYNPVKRCTDSNSKT